MREDWSCFRQVSPASDRWAAAGILTLPNSVVNTTPTQDTIRAFPFISPIRRRLTGISIANTSNTGTANVRLAIYNTKEDGTLYPDQLMYDSGDISVSLAGRYNPAVAPNLTIEPGKLYWACMNKGAGVLTAIIGVANSWVPVLGYHDNPLTTTMPGGGWSLGFTYAAYPTTFPAGATQWLVSNSLPFVYLRWSNV